MTNPQPDVLLSVADGIGTVVLNRPSAYNSFNSTLKVALLDSLRSLADDDSVRVVVITGSGPAFCAGQDLKQHLVNVRDDPQAALRTVEEFYNPMIKLIATMRKPVIAAVNGVAAGAGAGMAFACDLRIATASATFHTAFSSVAVSADSGLSYTLPRLIGLGRATRLTLLDEPFDAATALAWGAVDRVVPDADFAAGVTELATKLATGPTTAYAWIKASFAQAAQGDLTSALEFEDQAQKACFVSADHAEALDAFVGKRRAVFTGR